MAQVAEHLWYRGWAERNAGYEPEGLTSEQLEEIRNLI